MLPERIQGATVVGLILLASFAGCFGTVETVKEFAAAELHEFSAVVEYESGVHVTLTLSGPIDVMAQDHSLVRAYLLESEAPRENGPDSYQAWLLDGDLRVVAWKGGCGFVFSCGEVERWTWYYSGDLPPFGIGYPNIITSGSLQILAGGERLPVEWQASKTQERDRLELDVRMPSYSNATASWRIYTYEKGRLLPDGPRFNVLEYHKGSRLTGADKLEWPRPSPPAVPWEGFMFPGESSDTFGIGISHFDLALAVIPELEHDPGLCVTSYRLRIYPDPTPTLWDPVPVLGREEDLVADVQIGVESPSTWTKTPASIHRDRSDGSLSIEKGEPVRIDSSRTCDLFKRSPWPEHDVDEAAAFARTLLPEGDIAMFSHRIDRSVNWQEPETGWHAYGFGVLPASAQEGDNWFGSLHEVQFHSWQSFPLRSAVVPSSWDPFLGE